MKPIILLTIILLFFGCNAPENQSPRLNTGGGVSGNTKDLDKNLTKKEKEYKKLKEEVSEKEDDLADAEDDLDDVNDELEKVNEKLKTSRLTAEEREDLEEQKRDLESEKRTLQTSIASLRADITRLTGERDTARREKEQAERARDTAQTERDCWKKTEVSFCSRNEGFKTKVLSQIDGVTNCNNVNYCHLESLTTLDLSGTYDPSNDTCSDHAFAISKRDFAGFINLIELNLSKLCLSSGLPVGVFANLPKIQRINLQDTDINQLPSNFFTSGNIGTLVDGGVTVTDFVYCHDPEPIFKSKLGPASDLYPSTAGTKATYCYTE